MAKQKRFVAYSDMAKRLTGFSTPVFGVSWTPSVNERDVVRRLMVFLEDRRVLYADRFMEYGPWVDQSIQEIRQELTDLLKARPDDDFLGSSLRGMRAACRKYLDAVGAPALKERRPWCLEQEPWLALGELRSVFGVHLARLGVAYGVDIEGDLTALLPAEDTAETPHE